MKFTPTKKQELEAMNNLIKNNVYSKDDFSFSNAEDIYRGVEVGTPCIKESDTNFFVTAYEQWVRWKQINNNSK